MSTVEAHVAHLRSIDQNETAVFLEKLAENHTALRNAVLDLLHDSDITDEPDEDGVRHIIRTTPNGLDALLSLLGYQSSFAIDLDLWDAAVALPDTTPEEQVVREDTTMAAEVWLSPLQMMYLDNEQQTFGREPIHSVIDAATKNPIPPRRLMIGNRRFTTWILDPPKKPVGEPPEPTVAKEDDTHHWG